MYVCFLGVLASLTLSLWPFLFEARLRTFYLSGRNIWILKSKCQQRRGKTVRRSSCNAKQERSTRLSISFSFIRDADVPSHDQRMRWHLRPVRTQGGWQLCHQACKVLGNTDNTWQKQIQWRVLRNPGTVMCSSMSQTTKPPSNQVRSKLKKKISSQLTFRAMTIRWCTRRQHCNMWRREDGSVSEMLALRGWWPTFGAPVRGES